ncbi:MAG TPA: helix-turn-helix domain-containing protein [Phenylobacterium sp.]|nr:helix-turn-helix domain-containing protein [Phenylobacterium sp.]
MIIAPALMSSRDFAQHLTALRLSFAEAAQLLGVSERSVRRWADSEEVPGTAAAAVKAWRRLDDLHLAWKPDAVSIFKDDQDQIRRIRDHSGLLSVLLTEVEADGGPKTPWAVDIPKRRARSGYAEVGFYRLENGSFSPSTYRRLDRAAAEADWADARDASYCIAQALAKAQASHDALAAVAAYTARHADITCWSGPSMPSPTEKARRTRVVGELATRLDALAAAALDGAVTYGQFEELLDELHRAGFYPAGELVSAVAHSLLRAPTLEMMLADPETDPRPSGA